MLDSKPQAVARDCGVVQEVESDAHQLEDRVQEARGLPERETKEQAKCECRRPIAGSRRPAHDSATSRSLEPPQGFRIQERVREGC